VVDFFFNSIGIFALFGLILDLQVQLSTDASDLRLLLLDLNVKLLELAEDGLLVFIVFFFARLDFGKAGGERKGLLAFLDVLDELCFDLSRLGGRSEGLLHFFERHKDIFFIFVLRMHVFL